MARLDSKDRGSELAGRLTARNHFRKVLEASGQDKVTFLQLAEHIEDRFGDLVRIDQAEKEAQSIEPERIYVVDDDGVPRDILEVSELILTLKPMWRARIYARRDAQEDVKRACEEFVSKIGGRQ